MIFVQKIRKKKLPSKSADLGFHLPLQRRINNPASFLLLGDFRALRHSPRGLPGVSTLPSSLQAGEEQQRNTSNFFMFHHGVRITWRRCPWGSGVSWEPVIQGGSFVEKPIQRLKHVLFISFASGLLSVEIRCFVSLKNPLKTEMSQLIIPLSKTVKEMRVPRLLRDADSNNSCLAPNRQNSEEVSCISGRKYIENY